MFVCDDAAKVLSSAGIEADMSSTPVELQFISVPVVDECAHEVWDVEAKGRTSSVGLTWSTDRPAPTR